LLWQKTKENKDKIKIAAARMTAEEATLLQTDLLPAAQAMTGATGRTTCLKTKGQTGANQAVREVARTADVEAIVDH
jgi:hypothetical protein